MLVSKKTEKTKNILRMPERCRNFIPVSKCNRGNKKSPFMWVICEDKRFFEKICHFPNIFREKNFREILRTGLRPCYWKEMYNFVSKTPTKCLFCQAIQFKVTLQITVMSNFWPQKILAKIATLFENCFLVKRASSKAGPASTTSTWRTRSSGSTDRRQTCCTGPQEVNNPSCHEDCTPISFHKHYIHIYIYIYILHIYILHVLYTYYICTYTYKYLRNFMIYS
jgi:hypothetical protein